MSTIMAWWLAPAPRGRVAALRTIFYAFIWVDVLYSTSWVATHKVLATELYQPLFIGRLLPFPLPTEEVIISVQVALLGAAAIAASGRAPRLLGWIVFGLYFQWMLIAFSYGKVDHDRFAFLVALAVLPTAGASRWGDEGTDEASGFAIHSIQVAVVATYFLAALAKLRFGGVGWVNGATLMRAVVRRGTMLADVIAGAPGVLRMAQWGIMIFELCSPLLLVPGRIGRRYLYLATGFHLITFATITIVFLPHVICLLAFLPLERIGAARSPGTTGLAMRSKVRPAKVP